MKEWISLIICVIAWGVSEYLLITRLDMGIVDALLLAAFGSGCVGTVLFCRLVAERRKQKKESNNANTK